MLLSELFVGVSTPRASIHEYCDPTLFCVPFEMGQEVVCLRSGLSEATLGMDVRARWECLEG